MKIWIVSFIHILIIVALFASFFPNSDTDKRGNFQFRNKLKSVDFGPKNESFILFLAWQHFSLKIKNSHLCTHFLMPAISYNFRQTYCTDFVKSSEMLILGIKMPC